MAQQDLANLKAEIAELDVVQDVGRVTRISGGCLHVHGLSHIAAMGDLLMVLDASDGPLSAEVVSVSTDEILALPDGQMSGVVVGARVLHKGPLKLAPDDGWIGRIIDPTGQPIDGRPLSRGAASRAIVGAPPAPAKRRMLGDRLETGMAIFNTLLPIVRGQRIGLFAGSGVGKSSLLANFARALECDVVVIGLVGERGREVREFTERVLGAEGLARTVVVAATSDRSALMRRRCALSAMTVAEHFRDDGAHVLLLMDSITRFAEAHREIALASGEPASLGGFPPSMSHTVMSLAERAGPGTAFGGDITAIFSVLVAASDMDEPVADTVRGVLDGHVVMDRQIAERGRYPAIDPLRSISRSLPLAATEEENTLIARARAVLGTYDRAELMIQAGLYNQGSDPEVDHAILCWPKLDRFMAAVEPKNTAASFERLKSCLAGEVAHSANG